MSDKAPIYDEIIKDMESGLLRAVMRVISQHAGIAKRVGRLELVQMVKKLGFCVQLNGATADRKVRMAIQELRKDGHLICSSASDGGYYLARDRQEYEEFVHSEYRAKITDMAETLRAMDTAAEKLWGKEIPAEQMTLL